MSPQSPRRAPLGVTMPELMVVIGIIVVLMAILVPALRAVRTQTLTTSSMNNMRQIATFMNAYSRENREIILPSQFDYSNFQYKGHVRSGTPTTGEEHMGSWADILWTINNLGSFPGVEPYDAPDKVLYERVNAPLPNPLRSAMANSKNAPVPEALAKAKPHGPGAHEIGLPGFFAANDFFNARPDAPEYLEDPTPAMGRWWATGQIRSPERSMYLVDSFYGEVIAPEPEPFDNVPDPGTGVRTIEVDFRYSGSTLMLMLDGSVRPEGPWQELDDLEEQRAIRVRQLDQRVLQQVGP